MRKTQTILASLSILLCMVCNIYAQSEAEEPSFLTRDWGGSRSKLSDRGIDFTIEYIAGYHSNVSGGIKRGGAFNGVLNTGVDIDFEKLSDWQGFSFHLNTFWIHGKDGSTDIVGDFGGYNNIYHDQTFRLYTAWFQKTFWDNKISLKGGILAFDDDFSGSDSAALFINSDFGASAVFSSNMPVPIFAIPSIGLYCKIEPCEKYWIQFAVYDGDPSHINTDGDDDNLHGTDFRWNNDEGLFVGLETGVNLGDSFMGTYKLGVGYHTADFVSLDVPIEKKSGNYGIYFLADQVVYKYGKNGNSSINVFTRIAFAPDDRNEVELAFECGVCSKGIFGRENDTIGLGFAQTKLTNLGSESVSELTYNLQLKPWFAVQPDIQYIMNPSTSSSGLDDAFVVGLRGTISF